MPLTPGTRLGPYEVSAQLGAGGMGEVYRARDAKLNRDVALKVLPESFASDADRLARFTREAQTLAALNHPNIAHIHGLEESSGTRALVMELVEGDDLSQRISRGAIPIVEALPIAKQIAEALEAAHEQGIIHRDLKPANIKVRDDGTVKVLDFGLAKALEPGAGSREPGADLANSPTITSPAMTMRGVILGTAAYMAPEQARGKPVDRRADIWAFGCVLYEMLTGTRAFKGDDITDIITSVMRDEPDWTALDPSTPFGIRRLLKRCLTKDPRARLRDAGDLRIEIEEILSGPASDTVAASGSTPRRSALRGAALAAAVIVGAALAGAAAWYLKPTAPEAPLRKFSIQAPAGGSILRAAISPDGQSVAYVVGGTLWVRRLDTLAAREFPGTSDVNEVFWSPDSRMIGFEAKVQLWKVAASGGVPEVIGRVSRAFSLAGGAVWLPDDRIVFVNGNSGLREMSALGGEERSFLDVDAETELDFHNISVLPDGKGYLFVPHRSGAGVGVAIDVFDGARRRTLLQLNSGQISRPVYSSGHIVYARDDGAIWAVPFALDRGEVTGEPFRVVANGSMPTVAQDGTLTFLNESAGHDDLELAWVNARAELMEVVGAKGHWLDRPRGLRGTRWYVGSRFSGLESAADNSTVWIVDSANGTERRLTYEPGVNRYPVWSKDGTRVVYACAQGICSRPADGSGQPLVLVPAPATSPELSPDDTVLLFIRNRKIYQVPLGASGVTAAPTAEPKRFLDTDRLELSVTVSPSGAYAAYESNEPGSSNIFITAFPSGQGRWPVGRGQVPHWSETGDRLYIMGANGIDAVDVTTKPALSVSEPRSVLTAPGIEFQHGWGMSADGSRFLVNRSASLDTGASVTVVQNWFAEFASSGRR